MTNFDIGAAVLIRDEGRNLVGVVTGHDYTSPDGTVIRYSVSATDPADGDLTDVHHSDLQPVPVVGMPATITLYTDTVAAVVVHVTASRVTVREVPTGAAYPAPAYDQGDYPVMCADGDITRPQGGDKVFRWSAKRGRFIGGGDGSTRLILGRSFSLTDYRH